MFTISMSRYWVASALLASVAIGQTAKKQPKPFVLPPDVIIHGVVFAAVVPNDIGCAKDYLKLQTMEGIAKRKQTVDLIRFGCAVLVTSPYTATAKEPVTLTVDKLSARFRHVLLVRDDLLAQVTVQTRREALSPQTQDPLTIEGWIREEDILKLTREEVILAYPGALKRFVDLANELSKR